MGCLRLKLIPIFERFDKIERPDQLDAILIVDVPEDRNPSSFYRVIDRWRAIGIVHWCQLLVHPRWQKEDDIVGSDGLFEQVDGVVSLEADEQSRIDDVCLNVGEERVRRVDSLPATVVDRCVQLVDVGALFEIGIDI
jgi:hypothetical protein